MRTALLALATLAACAAPPSTPVQAQRAPLTLPAPATPHSWARGNPAWVTAVEPFRVIGPVYYVGSADLASFLIRTRDGFILLDAGLPDNAPMIADSIAKLGFDLRDVKILLNSHAHFDHSGGFAALKAATGATLIASEGDRSALEGGFYLGSEDNASFSAPPVRVDRTIADGGTVTLGGVTMTARLTPGHSRGCTTWTMRVSEGGADYDVLFFCSATVAANRLVSRPQYEGIVADYRRTFEITKDLRPDVFLAAHAGFFDMEAKRQRLLAGDPLAFVDREGFPRLRERLAADFERQLAAQQAALEGRK
jgi:metallo-beta-lactamase class B